MTVIERDDVGRPLVMDIPGEGRARARSWRQDAETREWLVTSYVLEEPSPEWVEAHPQPQPEPSADEVDAGALRDFVRENPDPATWTAAQLREGLVRLIRLELRQRRIEVGSVNTLRGD